PFVSSTFLAFRLPLYPVRCVPTRVWFLCWLHFRMRPTVAKSACIALAATTLVALLWRHRASRNSSWDRILAHPVHKTDGMSVKFDCPAGVGRKAEDKQDENYMAWFRDVDEHLLVHAHVNSTTLHYLARWWPFQTYLIVR